MASSNFTYTFFRIAKDRDSDNDIALSARKYKQLRLKALQTAPSSFSSTFEIESAFQDSDWIARLKEDGVETFICGYSQSSNQREIEWVGQVTIRGPLSMEEFNLPDEAYDDDELREMVAAVEERWQMLSLFVFSEHRGRGLAKSLCREALGYIKSEYRKQQKENICIRLMVKPENQVTVALYRQLGFVQVGHCTLAEALVANGDRGLLPGDISSDKFSARSGLIMVLHLKRMTQLIK